MIVALARKLIIALWRFVTTGEPASWRLFLISRDGKVGARSRH
jgi:hypothetical protein